MRSDVRGRPRHRITGVDLNVDLLEDLLGDDFQSRGSHLKKALVATQSKASNLLKREGRRKGPTTNFQRCTKFSLQERSTCSTYRPENGRRKQASHGGSRLAKSNERVRKMLPKKAVQSNPGVRYPTKNKKSEQKARSKKNPTLQRVSSRNEALAIESARDGKLSRSEIDHVRHMLLQRGSQNNLVNVTRVLDSVIGGSEEEKDLESEEDVLSDSDREYIQQVMCERENERLKKEEEQRALERQRVRIQELLRNENEKVQASFQKLNNITCNEKQEGNEQSAFVDDDADVPDAFLCPITYEIMKDPVVAADGHSYERKAIEQWLEKKSRSPMTGKPLASKVLTSNHILKSMIEDLIRERSTA